MRYIFILFAVLLCGSAHAQETIGNPDCRIVNPHPVQNESVTWHGACKEGYADGKGVLIWRIKGKRDARYEGAMVRGLRQGEAAYQDHDGTIYWGEYVQNELHGKVRFEREHEFAVDAVFEHGVVTGPVSAGFTSGKQYQGGWADGGPDGYGTMTYATGGSYAGEWLNGEQHGEGTVTYPNNIARKVWYDQGKPSSAITQEGKPREFRLGREPTSMYRLDTIVSGIEVPPNKPYAEMTPQEQQIVRARFAILQDDDVPPYPAKGVGELFRAISHAHEHFGRDGVLAMDVLIDEQGAPQNVAIRHTPDQEIADFVGKAMLLIKYTPARCGGKPCAMRFPLSIQLMPPG